MGSDDTAEMSDEMENPSLRDPRIRAAFEKMTEDEKRQWLAMGQARKARRERRALKRLQAQKEEEAKRRRRLRRSGSVPRIDCSGRFARRDATVQVDLGDVEKELAKGSETKVEVEHREEKQKEAPVAETKVEVEAKVEHREEEEKEAPVEETEAKVEHREEEKKETSEGGEKERARKRRRRNNRFVYHAEPDDEKSEEARKGEGSQGVEEQPKKEDVLPQAPLEPEKKATNDADYEAPKEEEKCAVEEQPKREERVPDVQPAPPAPNKEAVKEEEKCAVEEQPKRQAEEQKRNEKVPDVKPAKAAFAPKKEVVPVEVDEEVKDQVESVAVDQPEGKVESAQVVSEKKEPEAATKKASAWGTLRFDTQTGPIEVASTMVSSHIHKHKEPEKPKEPAEREAYGKRWNDRKPRERQEFRKQRPEYSSERPTREPSHRREFKNSEQNKFDWVAPPEKPANPFVYKASDSPPKPATAAEPEKPKKYDSADPRVAYYVRDPNVKREKHRHPRPRVVLPEQAVLSDEQAQKFAELQRQRRDIVFPEYPDRWMLDSRVEYYETTIQEIEAEIQEIRDRIAQSKGKKIALEKLESQRLFKKRQLSRRISEHCRKIERLNEQIVALDSEMQALRSRHSQLEHKYEIHSMAWRKDMMDRLVRETETASLSNYELKQRLAKVNRMMSENQWKYADMEENELEQETLKLQKKGFIDELAKHRKERMLLFKQRDALDKEIQQAGVEVGAKSDDVAHLEKDIQDKQAVIADKKRIVTALIHYYFTNLDRWTEQTAKLEAIDAQMQAIIDSL